jgi:hypothetical protein
LKGSYYANPVVDEPSVHPNLREAYPEYYGNNICRCRIFVPQMTSNFEYCRAQGREGYRRLRICVQAPRIVRYCRPILLSGQLRRSFHSFVFDVGVKLAAACQQFASPHLTNSSLSLSKIISTQTIKARLLHYFPPSPGSPLPADDEPVDSWCGFHVDHSLLTGLCSVCLALLSVILE